MSTCTLYKPTQKYIFLQKERRYFKIFFKTRPFATFMVITIEPTKVHLSGILPGSAVHSEATRELMNGALYNAAIT